VDGSDGGAESQDGFGGEAIEDHDVRLWNWKKWEVRPFRRTAIKRS
jgi:hypothetical protein